MKRDYINEILSKKARLHHNPEVLDVVLRRIRDISILSEFIHEAISENVHLNEDVQIFKKDISIIHYEAAKYIPIGLVSCIETYFKNLYSRLIDNNLDFRGNAAKFDIKFTFKTVVDLENGGLTAGEFIAHLLSINGLNDINSTLTKIMDMDYLSNLKEWRAKEESQLMLIPMTNEEKDKILIEGINEIYQFRHQFCHESVSIGIENIQNVLRGPNYAAELIWLTEKYISEYI